VVSQHPLANTRWKDERLPFVTGQYRQCHQPVERQETAVVATVEHHSMTSAVAVAVAVVPKDV
jgi:hypothetical protein